MRLIELKCQNCGAAIKINANQKEAVCEYCGAKFAIDDEVQHIHYDNAEQAGYEFEKGRQKAQAEQQAKNIHKSTYAQQVSRQQKKNRIWLWVIGWIIIFPLPLTILMVRNKGLNKWLRIGIIVVAWMVYFAIGASGGRTNSDNPSSIDNNPIENISKQVTIAPEKSYSLDGIVNNSSSSYRKNEELITKFVCEVNETSASKIVSVDFKNNHKKATLTFNDDSTYTVWDQVDNSSVNYNFGIEIGFNNGKATVDNYDGVITAMINVLDNNYDIEKIQTIISEAKKNGSWSSDSIYVEYKYTENAVGYQQGDHYWVSIQGNNYK